MDAYLAGVVGTWQVVIILVVVLLLFGGKKIPELMEGVGKGVKSFKKGMSEVEEEIDKTKKELNQPTKKEE